MKHLPSLLLPFVLSLAAAQPSDTSLNDTACCQAVTLQRGATSGDFDSAYAFRGYRFGTSHMRINGLRMKSVHGRNIWYQVEGGLNIGRARMRSMDLGFRDDRFYGVYALPADYQSFVDVKAILDSVYGPPNADSNASSVTYLWNVPNVVVKLRLYWADRRMEDRRNDRILSLIATPELLDKKSDANKNNAAPDSTP